MSKNIHAVSIDGIHLSIIIIVSKAGTFEKFDQDIGRLKIVVWGKVNNWPDKGQKMREWKHNTQISTDQFFTVWKKKWCSYAQMGTILHTQSQSKEKVHLWSGNKFCSNLLTRRTLQFTINFQSSYMIPLDQSG